MQSCPISFVKYDNTVSRIISLLTALVLGVYLFFELPVAVVVFLFIDLVMRVFFQSSYSPLYHLAVSIKKALGLPSVFKDGASKRLASYFGMLFLVLVISLDLLHASYAHFIVSGIYLFCLLLDTFLDFCLGCRIYYIIKKIYPSFME